MTGLLATVAGRQVFVPADRIAEIDRPDDARRSQRSTCARSSGARDEVLLKEDVLDRQLINIDGARLVRSNEIELARLEGWYRVVGVDIGLRGFVRRLLPRVLADGVGPSTFLDWASVEPFTGHVPTVRLEDPSPEARNAPSGSARRPRRGRVASGGRGDHRGGRAATPSSRRTCSRSSRPVTSANSSRNAPTKRSPR